MASTWFPARNSDNFNLSVQGYKACERCKASQAILSCLQCSPFNTFCSKCDTNVHSLPSKMKHQRLNMTNQTQEQTANADINKSSQENAYLNQSQQNPNNISGTGPLCYYPAANISYIENTSYSKANNNEYKSSFTKEYVTELKNIHQKEKNELLFKINSLENTLERLKASFSEHIQKMQERVDETHKDNEYKIKKIEEENEVSVRKLFDEKDLENTMLKNQWDKYRQQNEELWNEIKQRDCALKDTQESMNDEIAQIKSELQAQKHIAEKAELNVKDKIDSISKEYETKIQKILLNNEDEINDLNIKNKWNWENISAEIQSKERENYILSQKINEINKQHHEMICEWNTENDSWHKELKYIQEQNTSIYNKLKETETNLINTRNENEIALKSIQRQREELTRKGEDLLFMENTINSLKNSNNLLSEKNLKLQNDYAHWYSHAENWNYEYSTKLKSLNYVEDKNFVLERENNDLRNKMGRFVRPYSFNAK